MNTGLLRFLTLIIVSIGTFSCTHIFANQAHIDPSFDTRLPIGFNSQVSAITFQSDDKIVIGGVFTNYKGITSNYIIRLYADGNRDSSFDIGGGFNDAIKTLAIQSDGKVFAGGDFTNYSGVSANRIIRLNTNGTVDTSFAIGNGFNGTVNALVIQSDGRILVGGDFTAYNGTLKKKIIRLNANGTIDSSFSIGGGFSDIVNTLALQNDGRILVGGDFTKYGTNKSNRIIRLNSDGNLDTSFAVGDGFSNIVNTLVIQDDGKILVGGDFTAYSGTIIHRIIRLNTGGTIDTSFNVGGGFDFSLNTLAIQSGGKILVGGAFTNYSGALVNFIARLNTGGTIDTSFTIGNGFNNTVHALMVKNDGKILVGGAFTTYSGNAANRIIRLNTSGINDPSFNVLGGLNDTVWSVITQSDGKIVAGGLFTSYGGETTNDIIRLNTDGNADTSFIIGGGFNDTIRTLALQNDGKIIAGGNFTSYSGTAITRIIRLNTDGTRDTGFTIGAGFNGSVNALAVQNDGKIIAGGNFTAYNGVTANGIIRLNTGGTIDDSFTIGGGFNGSVNSLAIQNNGEIIVGGAFTKYGTATTKKIIRLHADGTKDSSFNIGGGFNDTIYALTIQSGGEIIVGGNFTAYSGTIINKIARLNTDGTKDSSFNIGGGFNAAVNTITTQSDGKILVGGAFTTYSGRSVNFIARLYTGGNIDTAFDIGNGFNDIVNSMTIQSGGKIFVGGDFTNYGGIAAGYLVALYGESSLIILPNSANSNNLGVEFANKGYTATTEGDEGMHRGDKDLSGSISISLELTDGHVPVGFDLINQYIELSLPKNLQFKKYDNITNYPGIISAPMKRSVSNIHNKSVLVAFKVGSSIEPIKLTGGVALLGFPVPGANIGSLLQVYYSQDNGVSWNPQTTTFVVDNNGQPYASFPTNHFTDFAVTVGSGDFTGSFVINNDVHSTPARDVIFNISTTPAATYMRFSNDGFIRSGRQTYSTTPSRMLSTGVGMKTVYAEFDTDNDTGTSEASVNDTIYFYGSIGSLFINNDDLSTSSPDVTLNLSGTPAATYMRFSNDGFIRSGRQTYATSQSRTLSPGTGEKMVYAEFDTNNNINTIEVAMNDTIVYDIPTTGGCIGAGCGDITLRIMSNGEGYCEIGDSVNFGLTGYSASSRTLESLFPTVSGNNAWFCNDLTGKASRTLDISSTDLFNITTNNPAHTITGANVFIKNPAAQLVQGVCTANSGSSLNQRISIGGINVPLLGKIGNLNEVCKISTSQVDLRVQIPAYQALGQYSGTLTITVPDLS